MFVDLDEKMYIRLFVKCSLIMFCVCLSCKKETGNISSRTYRMGFANSGPSINLNQYIESLNMWTLRADAAIISTEVPWDTLLSGTPPQTYVINNYKSLTAYYRSKNFKLWLYIDPANGLNRASDAGALVAIHKSIAQTEMQQIYQRFVFVMDSIIAPDHLGLALETNLIRDSAPDSVYKGIKTAASNAAAHIRQYDKTVRLSVSVQVDWAWGKLVTNGNYKGVDQDFNDFPFIQELGLSSYPYFGFNNPADIPINYYSQLIAKHPMPVFVSEGGWSSAKVGSYNGTPQLQQDYITKQGQLLDQAKSIAVFQLTFTDIEISAISPGTPSDIALFTSIGLVDTLFNPKPSLTAWDQLFKLPLTTGN